MDKYIKEKEKDKERDRDRERAEREKDKDFNPTKHWKSVRVKWTTDADASWPNVNNELQAISMLGKGSFATVYEAYDRRLKLNVAVKVYEKKDLSMPERRIFIQNEIDIMANIGHPAIVKFYRLLEDSKAIYIVQEIGGNMSLSEFVRHGKDKKLEEADARQLFKELVSSTTYLHSLKICHRDLKLTNILINGKGRLKLIDFGFAQDMSYNKLVQ